MRHAPRRSVSLLLSVTATAASVLIGCGVSGKTSDNALTFGSSTTATTTQGTAATEPPSATEAPTTEPDSTESTGSTTTTTITDGSNPFDSADFKKVYLGILKRAGYTDKEAKCVLNFVSQNGLDPNSTNPTPDLTKILKCLGADGRPGGND